MKKYSIGVDLGTLSARALLVDCDNGNEISSSEFCYPNKVIEKNIPDTDISLEHEWALQSPFDYIEALESTIKEVIEKSNVPAEKIVGIGIDFTSCTMMPVNVDGQVLCQQEKYYNNPHAWIKLWKHHAAQSQADYLNEVAKDFDFLELYGGKISAEWMIPKIMQIVDEAPEIYEKAYTFMEACDWIVLQLTDKFTRSSSSLGYKAIWNEKEGFPDKEFFKRLNPLMENIVEEKFKVGEIKNISESAGFLSQTWQKKLGLTDKTIVAVGNIDAHVCVSASSMTNNNSMLMIMGTSTCDITLSDELKIVPGMCGALYNGAILGKYAYESGQNSVGDIFAWFTNYFINEELKDEANKEDIGIHELLTDRANKLQIGESGLIALDWFNGNRSILVDTNLSGCLLGLTLQTKPEEVYRTLIEATAFGKRKIIESFEESGVYIEKLYACGGLPHKNSLLMQIYADVCQRPIYIIKSKNASALGSSICAAVAANVYEDLNKASESMGGLEDKVYIPILKNVKKYESLYKEYVLLHDYFGLAENNVMKKLKEMRKDV